MSDNIVEGDEMFSINLVVPSSSGDRKIVADDVSSATGIILDSTSKNAAIKRVCPPKSQGEKYVWWPRNGCDGWQVKSKILIMTLPKVAAKKWLG